VSVLVGWHFSGGGSILLALHQIPLQPDQRSPKCLADHPTSPSTAGNVQTVIPIRKMDACVLRYAYICMVENCHCTCVYSHMYDRSCFKIGTLQSKNTRQYNYTSGYKLLEVLYSVLPCFFRVEFGCEHLGRLEHLSGARCKRCCMYNRHHIYGCLPFSVRFIRSVRNLHEKTRIGHQTLRPNSQ